MQPTGWWGQSPCTVCRSVHRGAAAPGRTSTHVIRRPGPNPISSLRTGEYSINFKSNYVYTGPGAKGRAPPRAPGHSPYVRFNQLPRYGNVIINVDEIRLTINKFDGLVLCDGVEGWYCSCVDVEIQIFARAPTMAMAEIVTNLIGWIYVYIRGWQIWRIVINKMFLKSNNEINWLGPTTVKNVWSQCENFRISYGVESNINGG